MNEWMNMNLSFSAFAHLTLLNHRNGYTCWLTHRQLPTVSFHKTYEPVSACCCFDDWEWIWDCILRYQLDCLRRIQVWVYTTTQYRTRTIIFLGSCKTAHFLVTCCPSFTMSLLSHEFKPHILCLALADIWKKQCIKFINPDLLFMLKRGNHSTKFKAIYYLSRQGLIPEHLCLWCVPNQVSPPLLKLFKSS